MLKPSTILRYLPAYFDFIDDEEQMSPKNSKRQKVVEKQEKISQILKPMNICDCDFESIPDPDLAAFN